MDFFIQEGRLKEEYKGAFLASTVRQQLGIDTQHMPPETQEKILVPLMLQTELNCQIPAAQAENAVREEYAANVAATQCAGQEDTRLDKGKSRCLRQKKNEAMNRCQSNRQVNREDTGCQETDERAWEARRAGSGHALSRRRKPPTKASQRALKRGHL